MITRIWHGWTSIENSSAYETLLTSEIFVHIQQRKLKGYNGIELMRRNKGQEVEFVTIMYFDDIDAVKHFAGEKYETSVVPEKAQKLLKHYDAKAQHYHIITERK